MHRPPLLLLFFAATLLAVAGHLSAHPADSLWMRTFGTGGAEIGYDVAQTPDLGFVAAGSASGTTYLASGGEVYVVRTDAAGSVLWQKRFGVSGFNWGYSVTVTPDGGIAVAGASDSWGPGPRAAFLLRLDDKGDSLWLRTYGGNGSDGAYAVETTADGGFILAGFTGSFGAGGFDAYLVRTDSLGNEIWSRAFGGDENEDACDVITMPDGGFMFAGKTESYGKRLNDFYVVRTDADGNPLWEKTYGGYQEDMARSICRLSDGMYVVAGSSDSFHQDDVDGYMVKIDALGGEFWFMYTGRTGADYFESVSATHADGCIAAGVDFSLGDPNAFLLEVDEHLATRWIRVFSLGFWEDDYARSIERTAEGSYAICGNTFSYGAGGTDLLLIKTVDEVAPATPGFEVLAGDGEVALHWTNPPNVDVEGTHIRWATKTYPEEPDWGWPVSGPDSAHFAGEPDEQDSSVFEGLLNGQKYYFCAFAYDRAGNYSGAAKAKATPRDPIPPEPPSEFRAVAQGNDILLSWNHSVSTDIVGTHVRYSTLDYPEDPDSGQPVPSSLQGDFWGEPGSEASFLHEWLVTGQAYFYSAFAFDSSGNYSSPDTAAAVPVDLVPPDPPLAFSATPGEGKTTLNWIASATPDVEGVRVVFSEFDYPTHPDSGLPVPSCEGGDFRCEPAEEGSFVHKGLVNGRTYYYAAFCYDEVFNYSSPAQASALPLDITPPAISLAVLQNPYLTRYLDIYIIGDENLQSGSPTLAVAGDLVPVSRLDTLTWVWRGDYHLPDTAGVISLVCTASDSVGNDTTLTTLFTATPLGLEGGTVTSACGDLRIAIGPGDLWDHCNVLVLPVAGTPDGSGQPEPHGLVRLATGIGRGVTDPQTAFLVLPRTALGRGEAYLEWHYDESALPEDTPASWLYIEDDSGCPLECFVDAERQTIAATAKHLGLFKFGWGTGPVSDRADPDFIELTGCAPNPFTTTTTMTLVSKSRQPVRVSVLDTQGRLVAILLDGMVNPGHRTLTWDGKSSSGRCITPGVYFLRIANPHKTHSAKIILID